MFTCGLWPDVTEELWEDWHWQLKNRITSFEQLKQIMTLAEEEEHGIRGAQGRLSMAITPYFASLLDPQRPHCPLRRQCVPVDREFYVSPFDMIDPCGEDKDSPVPGIVHRYPDRILLLVTDQCAAYCRHCTRRRLIDPKEHIISPDKLKLAFDYIKANRKIRDVLISGGDPLMLENEVLEDILSNIRQIAHVEFLRIGTRLPVTLPQRITEELVNMLKKYAPLWISIHFNHPKEINKRTKKACDMLTEAGIPLGSQTVLLKGINDRPYIMKRLMHELLKVRVRPYYIYQCDLARGISHFRTSISVGINIMEKLRGFTSGYAVPTYVVDGPGGGGKIPVAPNYVISQAKNLFVLRNYQGKMYSYREEPESVPLTFNQLIFSLNSEKKLKKTSTSSSAKNTFSEQQLELFKYSE
ncbi:MAG: lysine 2,3-aminomutase [Candidatus Omnitrophica bacterium]|nr:lysine 2,3-aminomutase [Candidatus Omnitrophota bacterium]